MTNAKCINDGLSWKISAILNTLSEFVLATLPLLGVFRLGVDKRQRWSVIGVLSLGFFVALAGCLRSYYIWRALMAYDLTWWGGPQWICSELEIDVALVRWTVSYQAVSFAMWRLTMLLARSDLRLRSTSTTTSHPRYSTVAWASVVNQIPNLSKIPE